MVHVFSEHLSLSMNQPAIKKTEGRNDLANYSQKAPCGSLNSAGHKTPPIFP